MAEHSLGMRLRPLAIGDVLDETFRLYRRHFLSFVLIMAVVAVPMAVVGLLFSLVFGYGIDSGLVRVDFERPEQIVGMVIGVLILAVVGGIGYLLSSIAAVQLASNAVLGRPVAVGEAYRAAMDRFWPVSLASLLSGLAVGVLFATCIGTPFAVYLGLGWSVAMPAIVVEGLPGTDGLRRSWDLVRGHRWRLLVVFVLLGLIAWLLVSLPGGLVGAIALPVIALSDGSPEVAAAVNVLTTLVNAAGQALFGSLGLITVTIVYYDLLVRKEAFDLQQRAESLTEPNIGGHSGAPDVREPPGEPR